MNSRFLFILVFILGGLIGLAYYQNATKKSTKNKQVITMPIFQAFALDSTQISITKLNAGFATVFIHFNSTCDHCQYEAKELVKK